MHSSLGFARHSPPSTTRLNSYHERDAPDCQHCAQHDAAARPGPGAKRAGTARPGLAHLELRAVPFRDAYRPKSQFGSAALSYAVAQISDRQLVGSFGRRTFRWAFADAGIRL